VKKRRKKGKKESSKSPREADPSFRRPARARKERKREEEGEKVSCSPFYWEDDLSSWPFCHGRGRRSLGLGTGGSAYHHYKRKKRKIEK